MARKLKLIERKLQSAIRMLKNTDPSSKFYITRKTNLEKIAETARIKLEKEEK